MHTRSYTDNEGTFSDWKESKTACPKCGKMKVKYKEWESISGAYEDYLHKCFNCGIKWWVDGSDS